MTDIADNTSDVENYGKIAQWILLALCIVLAIIGIFVLLCLCRMCSKNTCLDKIYSAKLGLVLMAIFIIFLGVVVLFFMAGSVVTSGACEVIRRLGKG